MFDAKVLANIVVATITVVYVQTFEKRYRCSAMTSFIAVPVTAWAYFQTVGLPLVQNIFVCIGTWHIIHLLRFTGFASVTNQS